MSRAAAPEVLRQLMAAGLHPCCHDIQVRDVYLRFVLSDVGRALLAIDSRFARGVLHGLHADVGPNREDYRSHTGSLGRGSLQIVVDRMTGAAYADVDRWSPYSDVVGMVGHAGEVIGGWFKRLRA